MFCFYFVSRQVCIASDQPSYVASAAITTAVNGTFVPASMYAHASNKHSNELTRSKFWRLSPVLGEQVLMWWFQQHTPAASISSIIQVHLARGLVTGATAAKTTTIISRTIIRTRNGSTIPKPANHQKKNMSSIITRL
jgi:hypothetical protein